ncbi:hypothetical protein C6500_18600 [Candidatus Poribacteria bacterium]|nr:MAG: hypothetical protein C6500_18600 [Candidatus Poribacteria bacterium]
MKGLIAQRFICSTLITFLLTFSVYGVTDALIPDTTIRIVPWHTSEPIHKGTTIPIATKDDIAISEIMYASNADKPPQWIELHNRSARRVSLEGWEVTIENHPEDTTVLATKLTFTLGEKILNADQVLLLVTEQGHNSGVGETKSTLQADSIVILKDLIGGMPRYRLLSQTAFKITLRAPAPTKTERKRPSDIAGNLGVTPEWKLPSIEGKLPLIAVNQRSSIIRAYKGNDASDGTRVDSWELATEKSTRYIRGIIYYGHYGDHGTPGYRVDTPLPVDSPVALTHFRPGRDKMTDAVVITWTTQSELSNAGFFIKRSQQRDGELKIINATMIPGAGTTNEKQSYTYTDTTAEPNVVYYYQIECVSVDGTRRTLTRPIRLKGHIGFSGRRIRYILWNN